MALGCSREVSMPQADLRPPPSLPNGGGNDGIGVMAPQHWIHCACRQFLVKTRIIPRGGVLID